MDKFCVIELLNMYNIFEASAGVNDSLFITSEGKIIDEDGMNTLN